MGKKLASYPSSSSPSGYDLSLKLQEPPPNLYLNECQNLSPPEISSASLYPTPVSIFYSKPLPALLFFHQQAWPLQPPTWPSMLFVVSMQLVSFPKRGPPLLKKERLPLSRVVMRCLLFQVIKIILIE